MSNQLNVSYDPDFIWFLQDKDGLKPCSLQDKHQCDYSDCSFMFSYSLYSCMVNRVNRVHPLSLIHPVLIFIFGILPLLGFQIRKQVTKCSAKFQLMHNLKTCATVTRHHTKATKSARYVWKNFLTATSAHDHHVNPRFSRTLCQR